MKSLLAPGKYVIAVSGGVDSVVLLHMLRRDPELELIVAHFDHGIREDSTEDADFVQGLADLYNVQYESAQARLGPNASEEVARTHRYAFLEEIKSKHSAAAIVTAHHQDDRIETAAINILRGTMRRGLVSLRSHKGIQRPLLGVTKEEIRQYALKHGLEYCEDSTNASKKYLRNRVRGRLYASLTPADRKKITMLLDVIEVDNQEIDVLVKEILEGQGSHMQRSDFISMDATVLFEVVAQWLRNHNAVFDKNTIVRICNGARTLRNGAKIDIDKRLYCQLTRNEIIITRR